MSLTKKLSSKVIVVVETVAIVVLAVVVVIYAQVLVQQYAFQNQVGSEQAKDESLAEAEPASYSAEERMRVLEELRAVRGDEIAPEDRQAALDALVSEQVVSEPTPEQTEERMRVLQSLEQ